MHSVSSNQPTTANLELRSRLRAALRKVWGYDDFRSPQADIIESLLTGHDTLIIMPTGGGKSICFQLPALIRPGLTLVISPLIALMENQVQDLRRRKQPAAVLHSQLPRSHQAQTLRELESSRLRLLYLSPETLLSEKVWSRLCQPTLPIHALVVDEAHCLAQWGETFRPAYQRLGAVRSSLLRHKPPGSHMAIAAFTATADPLTQQAIEQGLGLKRPNAFRLSPYRANLHLSVHIAWTPRGRRQRLLQFIQAHPDQAGLVYVRSRQEGEELADWLRQQGYATAAYHAGVPASDRRAIEAAWLSGSLPFVVSTSAFGMGIDKGNVRWIAHFHPPALLSEYVQEIGRAGRDGQDSEALMLVSEPTAWLDPGDRQRQRGFEQQLHQQERAAQSLIRQIPSAGTVRSVEQLSTDAAMALALLHRQGKLVWPDPFHYRLQATQPTPVHLPQASKKMRQYLYTDQCRWHFLLQAFGATEGQVARCGHCDRCDRQS